MKECDDTIEIAKVLKKAKLVLVAGNGGSSCNAEHLAMHLREMGIVAINLSESCGFTAKSNDYGSGRSFIKQIEPFDDFVLVLISSSGESTNILYACDYARSHNKQVVALTTPSSTLAKQADYVITCMELKGNLTDGGKRLQAELHEEQSLVQIHELVRSVSCLQ